MTSNDGGRDTGAATISLRRFDVTVEGVSTPPVYCPHQQLYVSLTECRACDECDGIVTHSKHGAMLQCSSASAHRAQMRSTGADAGPEATVSAIMTHWVTAVTADTLVSELASVFVGHGISAAPVVDGEGHAIGVVSKSDIVRYLYESGGGEVSAGPLSETEAMETRLDDAQGIHVDVHRDSTVGEVMTPLVFGIPAQAPVYRAAALMAFEHVHHLLVTDDEHNAVGMLSSLDVMAWLGRQDGYIIPGVHPSEHP